MNSLEVVGFLVAFSLVATEIALVVSINRTVREIRGLRKDLPAMLATALGLSLLAEAARRFFPVDKSNKE